MQYIDESLPSWVTIRCTG